MARRGCRRRAARGRGRGRRRASCGQNAIFGLNNARLYGINPKKAELELKNDKLTALKAEYDKGGREPSNLRYGYVAEPVSDFSVYG